MDYPEAIKRFGSSTRNQSANQKPVGNRDVKGRVFVLGLIIGILVGAAVVWIRAADHFEDFRARSEMEIEELKSTHTDRITELETTIEHLEAEVIGLRDNCLVFDDETQGK